MLQVFTPLMNMVVLLEESIYSLSYPLLCNTTRSHILRCMDNLMRFNLSKEQHMLPYYNGVIRSTMAHQITTVTSVYPTVYSGANQINYQSSASLAFVRGIPRWPVNSPHKGPVTRKMFPFDDVIMCFYNWQVRSAQQNINNHLKHLFQ